jgi:hypothetical protein
MRRCGRRASFSGASGGAFSYVIQWPAMQDRAFALNLLQCRLDALQAQHLILGKRTDVLSDDRKRQQSAIYSDLTKLAADWMAHPGQAVEPS